MYSAQMYTVISKKSPEIIQQLIGMWLVNINTDFVARSLVYKMKFPEIYFVPNDDVAKADLIFSVVSLTLPVYL